MSNKILRKMIEGSEGKFFSVVFKKANGDLREMNCRTGVKKHLRGGDSTTAHKDNLVTVWDTEKKAYRCINLDTVTKVSLEGKVFEVSNGE